MKTKHSIENPGWELVVKYLNNEATTVEKETVEKWVTQSEQNKGELQNAKILLETTDEFFQLRQFDTNAAWHKTRQRIRPEIISIAPRENLRKKFVVTFYKYAAIIILAFLVGTAGYYFGLRNQLPGTYSEIISAEKQVINEYVLPDGSLVALNSNSKLEFPKKFKDNNREVTITGEAFFEVVPDPEKPFIINAGNAQVKVLGTSFNVSAYPENETVEVVVETGIVQVVCNEKTDALEVTEILLKPGEKGTLLISPGKLEKTRNTDLNYLAWKTHNLIFDETPLIEVVRYLNKAYHTEIKLNNENLENLVLTAQFEKKSVDFILNVLQLTFGLELIREDNIYILSEKLNI